VNITSTNGSLCIKDIWPATDGMLDGLSLTLWFQYQGTTDESGQPLNCIASVDVDFASHSLCGRFLVCVNNGQLWMHLSETVIYTVSIR